ncbi:unnamed protein product [Caenorhabditis angaria]|uniref:Uncharacterized protein n=1 Tax=Caenorhabditis angaria TaxID=860376 RepID=A0A9P1N7J3_9PELO|nr:unnamed protein product [Caenorhabditis angaria]
MEVEFPIDSDGDSTKKISIPIPLPKYTNIEDWVRKVCASETSLDYEDVYRKLRDFIRSETRKYEDSKNDVLILSSMSKNFAFPQIPKDHQRQPSFAEKFQFVVSKCSSQNLITLMQMEVFMKKEMTEMIRARNWEVEELTRKCEKVLDEHNDDMHPHQISMLNEKLRQVYVTYSHQVAQLSENQRQKYRKSVDSLFSHGSLPADFIEEIDLDESHFMGPATNSTNAEGVNESFTIYIGAQLKSMHNACLVTVDTMTDICQTFEGDWTTSSRLEMATKLYGRNLAAVTLLVPRDPMHHVTSSTKFQKLCEQSTELHFEPLAEQLNHVKTSTRQGNIWRAECVEKDDCGEKQIKPQLHDSVLSIGDVYCTKHSNLHKIQIVFHLVADDVLQSVEISSRHACLNGIRNIIKMTAHFGITSIHLPLLLIDRPDESTTIQWCVKRAEMVYKCVKGYLMEVCGGAANLESLPHYNVHFVLPSGLTPSIYTTIANMFPSIFHLVPSVSITL